MDARTDRQILEGLGERLRAQRLLADLTQAQLASRAGLSVSTVKGLEAGRGRLDSLVAVLRELGQLSGLDGLLPEPGFSPLQLAERKGLPRQRASGRRPQKRTRPKSDW